MGATKEKECILPVLLCFCEANNEEQKSYCIKLRDIFQHNEPIRYQFQSAPEVKFKIFFILNNKTYIIQDIFDDSEEALNESLNKIYKLLDGEDIIEKSNKNKKNDNSKEIQQNKKEVLTISFESIDQNINYKLDCNKDSIFKDIEEEIYKKYAEFRNIQKYYLYEGNMIDINKTFEENKIKDNSHILIVINNDSSMYVKSLYGIIRK